MSSRIIYTCDICSIERSDVESGPIKIQLYHNGKNPYVKTIFFTNSQHICNSCLDRIKNKLINLFGEGDKF